MGYQRVGRILTLALPLCSVGVTRAAAPAPVATLSSKVLKVTDARAGTNDYNETPTGKRLSVGDKVRTGLRAKAEIKLDDESVVRMGQATDITINPNREIDLPKGRIKFDFKNPARIRAGSTVADVRGSYGGFLNQGGLIRGTLGGGVMIVQTSRGPVNVTPGSTMTYNPSTGQVTVERTTNFTDQSSGDLAVVDPLGDTAFATNNTNYTPGSLAGDQLRTESNRISQDTVAAVSNALFEQAQEIATGTMQTGTVRGEFGGPATGGVNVGVSQRALRNFIASPTGSIGGTSSGGGTVRLPREGAAGPGGPRQGYFAPRSDGNVFAYWGQNGAGSAAVRLRAFGSGGQLYYEVAAVPTLTFHRTVTNNNFTDAFFVYRDRRLGDFTVGRQRFLKGPVQNTLFGTLLRQGGRDIQDAVNWSIKHRDKKLSTDIAYILDAFPSGVPSSQPGGQSGVSVRQGFTTAIGAFGLNAVDGNFSRGVGTTFDWSMPAIRSHLDFYGEFGSDGFGRQIRTFGLYFPGLFERFGFDVFVEQAKLDGFGNAPDGRPLHTEWLIRIYRQIGKNLSGLITLDERTGNGLTSGFGLVYKLQFK